MYAKKHQALLVELLEDILFSTQVVVSVSMGRLPDRSKI